MLGRLSGPWCDQLMNTSGSARRLEDLARRHLFLVSHDGGDTYQEHEVLRSFLEELLLDRVGEQGIRSFTLRRGRSSRGRGRSPRPFGPTAERKIGPPQTGFWASPGTGLSTPWDPGAAPPPAVADNDAWYLLAVARRQVRSGHWSAALDSYRRAEVVATGALVRQTCQRERFQLIGWVDPGTTVPHDWTGVLRRALIRDPLTALVGAGTRSPGERLACALAAVVAGHLSRSRRPGR